MSIRRAAFAAADDAHPRDSATCAAGVFLHPFFAVAILVLFKTNKNMKDNIKILLTIYGIGAISGIIIDLLKIMI